MKTMRNVGRFFKRVVKGYLDLNANNYAMRITGNVWVNPNC